jgi:hypothetical protein
MILSERQQQLIRMAMARDELSIKWLSRGIREPYNKIRECLLGVRHIDAISLEKIVEFLSIPRDLAWRAGLVDNETGNPTGPCSPNGLASNTK